MFFKNSSLGVIYKLQSARGRMRRQGSERLNRDNQGNGTDPAVWCRRGRWRPRWGRILILCLDIRWSEMIFHFFACFEGSFCFLEQFWKPVTKSDSSTFCFTRPISKWKQPFGDVQCVVRCVYKGHYLQGMTDNWTVATSWFFSAWRSLLRLIFVGFHDQSAPFLDKMRRLW